MSQEQPVRLITRWLVRADPWPIVPCALFVMLVFFWAYRTPNEAMVGYKYDADLFGGFIMFVFFISARALHVAYMEE